MKKHSERYSPKDQFILNLLVDLKNWWEFDNKVIKRLKRNVSKIEKFAIEQNFKVPGTPISVSSTT